MKDVLESHEVVRKTFSSIIDVDMCTKPELSGHLQIPISPINNFILMDSFIFAFKSYDIEEHLILSEKFKGVIKHGKHPRYYGKVKFHLLDIAHYYIAIVVHLS